MKSDSARLQRIIGYSFRNQALLKEALMHRSFAMENKIPYDNQRLEFLGDAVLQILLTEYLFKRYPDLHEGDLTKIRSALANQDSLAEMARTIELGDMLMFGRGELEMHGNDRDSTLCDGFESLLGAIMLDSNLDEAKKFLMKQLEKHFPDPEDLLTTLNPKGALQEFTQKMFGVPPAYETVSVSGEDHMPDFEMAVSVGGIRLASAHAGKRKLAEGQAADRALTRLKSGDIPNELQIKIRKEKES